MGRASFVTRSSSRVDSDLDVHLPKHCAGDAEGEQRSQAITRFLPGPDTAYGVNQALRLIIGEIEYETCLFGDRCRRRNRWKCRSTLCARGLSRLSVSAQRPGRIE